MVATKKCHENYTDKQNLERMVTNKQIGVKKRYVEQTFKCAFITKSVPQSLNSYVIFKAVQLTKRYSYQTQDSLL